MPVEIAGLEPLHMLIDRLNWLTNQLIADPLSDADAREKPS
ncbi:hypothetical protein [Sphingomonas caseinilyticus]|nr:hypothetical protein [Sphingomonas caseinilyticus]